MVHPTHGLKPARRLLMALGVALAGAAAASAFVMMGSRWPDGVVTMHLQLGPSTLLSDGSASWGESAEGALADWNQHISRVQFRVVRNSNTALGDGNDVNNVFFAENVYGMSFDTTTLAVTTSWFFRGTRTEADVVFNSRQEPWDSYSGPLRRGTTEFRRVALHEFGHVLGLRHPDDHGQAVSAIMNSRVGAVDRLTADDIAGATELYGPSSQATPSNGGGGGESGTVSFPPRNESLDFRSQLDAKYRDSLRRPAAASFVDVEGDVVWTQEYLRYRVNQCSHPDAVDRVMTQIDGRPDPGVCGAAPSGQVLFPPRNEALDFRNALEAKYRDGLRRLATSTHVDREGDVVWIQEYLRYRVNACSHGTAVQSVMVQIDGFAAPAVCR